MKSSKPLPDASVFISLGDQHCKTNDTVVKTGKEGGFLIDGQSQFRFYYVPMVAPVGVNVWSLCIEYMNKTILGIKDINFQYRNEELALSCDLDNPISYRISNGETIEAVCKKIKSANK